MQRIFMVSPVGFVEIEVGGLIFWHKFHHGKVSIPANNVKIIKIHERFNQAFTHVPRVG